MRKLKVELADTDCTIYLTEHEWSGLLQRYDWANIKETELGYELPVPCYLCEKHDADCNKCTLTGLPVGCLNLVETLSGEGIQVNEISAGKLEWRKCDDSRVREGLRTMRKLLLGMQYVHGRHQ